MDTSSESSGKTTKPKAGGNGLSFLDELNSSDSADEGQKQPPGNGKGVKKINVKSVPKKTGGTGGSDKERLLDDSDTDVTSSGHDANDQSLDAGSGAKGSKSTVAPRPGKGAPNKATSGASASNTVAATRPTFTSSVQDDEDGEEARPKSGGATTAQKRHSYTTQSVAPDQKLAAVKKDAENISRFATRNGQRDAFEKVLKSIDALEPNQRYAVLSKLVPHLALFSHERKITLIARMRALASAPMPAGDRGKLAALLLPLFIPNNAATIDDGNDQDAAAAFTSDPKSDAEEMDKTKNDFDSIERRIKEFQEESGSRKLDDLKDILQEAKALKNPVVELGCIVLILGRMDIYSEDGQERVVESLWQAFGVRAVVQALFQTQHLDAIKEALLKEGYCAPDVLQGFIEDDPKVVSTMACVLQALAGKQGKWLSRLHSEVIQLKQVSSNKQPDAPTRASQTRSILMDAVALSKMDVKLRCVLLNLLSSVDAETLSDRLRQANAMATDSWHAMAHQVIALSIRTSACGVLSHYAKAGRLAGGELRFYIERLERAKGEPGTRITREKDSVLENKSNETRQKGSVPDKKDNTKKKKDTASSSSFRDLLIAGDDPDLIKKNIKKILKTKNGSFSDKLARLEAKANPVAGDIREYTNREYLAAVQEKLQQKRDPEMHEEEGEHQAMLAEEKKQNPLPDYEHYVASTSQYSKTMASVSKSLSVMERQTVKVAVKKKMTEALKSKLPALHVAIMEDRLEAVQAYLESVLDVMQGQPVERHQLLEMKHGKQQKTAFYRAMFSGSPEMIALWVKTIAASDLPVDEKLALLDARRKDGLAAFYVAMSDGEKQRITAFIETVLAADLPLLYKEQLLKAKAPKGMRTLQLSDRQVTLESTARNQALRTEAEWKKRVAHHSVAGKVGFDVHERYLGPRDRKDRPSLVPIFDRLIFDSKLPGTSKAALTESSAASF